MTQSYRETQQLFGRYINTLFEASHEDLRAPLETGDEQAVKAVVKKIPAQVVEGFSEVTGLTKGVIYILLGTSQATVSRSSKKVQTTPIDVVDRAFQNTELFARTASMLGEEKARTWITKPNHHLNGKAPYQLMQTATGRERLSRYLESLEEVTYG